MKITDTSAQDVHLKSKRGRNRRIVGGSAVFLLLLLAWLAAPVVQRWADVRVTVPLDRLRVAEVTRGDLVRDVSLQGRVVAAVSPTLYVPAAGSITLEVDAGATVTSGQVVALVASAELQNQLQQGLSSLQQQSVELDRQRIESRQLALEKRKAADLASVALTAAQREKRRADRAHEVSVIAAADYEKAQDDLRNAELGYQHAEADADLFDERLAFELRANKLAIERQQLLFDELRSPLSAINSCRGSRRCWLHPIPNESFAA